MSKRAFVYAKKIIVLLKTLCYNRYQILTRENIMKSKRNSVFLALAAFFWGIAFVAQSKGGSIVGAFSFNCIRSFIGTMALVPVILLLDKLKLTSGKPKTKEDKKNLAVGGICCGIILTVATNLQQLGLNFGTSAGKAGFITACYIILVPILSIFLKKKCGWNIWVGVGLTVIGLYLLCMTGSLKLQLSDVLVLLCAVVFAMHILVIDHFSPLVDGVRMSCIQFLVCGILSFIPMLFVEIIPSGIPAWSATLSSLDAWTPILYAGIFSCGVAYTLQIVGQQNVNPTVASLIMSLESVFAVIAGALLLHERLSLKEILGCVLIFGAITLAQIPVKSKKKA